MRPFFALLLTLAVAPLADAALIVSIGSTQMAGNSTGSVDVFVRSTTGTDSLQIANLQFQITPNGGPAYSPLVSFTNPQSEGHLTAGNYVFAGNSTAALFSPLPSTLITTTDPNFPNDTYFGGDGTTDGSGILVPTTDLLLARLDLTAGPGAGSSYRISLVNSGFTSFLDENFDEITFSSTDGFVTTPEPATLAVFGGLLVAAGVIARRRRAAAATAA